jgi:hypothetical protein
MPALFATHSRLSLSLLLMKGPRMKQVSIIPQRHLRPRSLSFHPRVLSRSLRVPTNRLLPPPLTLCTLSCSPQLIPSIVRLGLVTNPHSLCGWAPLNMMTVLSLILISNLILRMFHRIILRDSWTPSQKRLHRKFSLHPSGPSSVCQWFPCRRRTSRLWRRSRGK